ncbi:glycosyltransferase family 39 protein [Humibacter sp.]|uniref:glycosyltransferase family 39 protein n=1 Tax=Humibacter sp. TaxID=1940291 RepID=UPI003F804E04
MSIALGAVGLLTSVAGSWIPSLWGDEAASQLAARRSIPGLLHLVQHVDAVHGTYYLFLHFWVKLFGYGAFSIRFPSAIAIGVCVALVVWLSARVSTTRVAVLAGIACAVLPRLTYAGGEARPFSFDAALSAGLFVIVVEIFLRDRPSRRLWAIYGVVLTIATYLFIYTGLVAVAVGVFILVVPGLRHHWRPWLIASASAAVTATPVLLMAVLERDQIAYLKSGEYASWNVIFKQMWFGDNTFAWLGWMLMAVAASSLLWRLCRRFRGWPSPDLTVLALSWLIVPMGLLLIANTFFALFTARYAAFTAPAAAILIALGIEAIAQAFARTVRVGSLLNWVAGALIAAVIAAAAPNWAGQRGPYSENQSDWNDIAATVREHSRPGDAIIFDSAARPSRRTRLAYDTASPGSFGSVQDVLLKTPPRENYTWYASTYTVEQAASLDRFNGVQRVWAVEYRTPAGLSGPHHPDSYGMTELEQLGYRPTASYQLHASVIYLLTETR